LKRYSLIAIVMIVLALSVLPVLSACGTAAPPAATKTIKIGQMLEMSGPFAPGLELVRQGTQVCTDYINDIGGIDVAGLKYNIEIILEDVKSTPEGAVAAANKLIYKDKVDFLLGPAVPPMAMANASVSEEAKIIRALTIGSGVPGELGPNSSYTFGPMSSTSLIGPVYKNVLEIHPEIKKVAIVGPDEPTGQYWIETSKKWAEKYGLEVVFTELYPVGTTDFFPLCTRLWDTKPDAIDLGVGVEPWKAGVMKGCRQLGFTGPAFSGDILEPNTMTALVGKDDAYEMYTAGLNPNSTDYTPMAQELKRRIDAEFPGVYQDRHTGGWSALWTLTEAIKRAGNLDSTNVRDTFQKMTNFETLYGNADMGGFKTFGVNNVAMTPRPFIKIDHGEITDIKIIKPQFYEDLD